MVADPNDRSPSRRPSGRLHRQRHLRFRERGVEMARQLWIRSAARVPLGTAAAPATDLRRDVEAVARSALSPVNHVRALSDCQRVRELSFVWRSLLWLGNPNATMRTESRARPTIRRISRDCPDLRDHSRATYERPPSTNPDPRLAAERRDGSPKATEKRNALCSRQGFGVRIRVELRAFD